MRLTTCATVLFLAGCPTPGNETIEVKLCDNHTTTEVDANAVPTPEFGRNVAATLMEKWQAEHPDVDWEADERASRTFLPAADNSALLSANTQAAGHPYRQYTELELLTWTRETEKLAVAGSRVFHSAKDLPADLASQIVVSESLHWFEVNVDDAGEPGKETEADCPADGFGLHGSEEFVNCDCGDFYRITIRATTDPSSEVIYTVEGYVTGNFQIHPLTGYDLH